MPIYGPPSPRTIERNRQRTAAGWVQGPKGRWYTPEQAAYFRAIEAGQNQPEPDYRPQYESSGGGYPQNLDGSYGPQPEARVDITTTPQYAAFMAALDSEKGQANEDFAASDRLNTMRYGTADDIRKGDDTTVPGYDPTKTQEGTERRGLRQRYEGEGYDTASGSLGTGIEGQARASASQRGAIRSGAYANVVAGNAKRRREGENALTQALKDAIDNTTRQRSALEAQHASRKAQAALGVMD